jgi:hypothetical protein
MLILYIASVAFGLGAIVTFTLDALTNRGKRIYS